MIFSNKIDKHCRGIRPGDHVKKVLWEVLICFPQLCRVKKGGDPAPGAASGLFIWHHPLSGRWGTPARPQTPDRVSREEWTSFYRAHG